MPSHVVLEQIGSQLKKARTEKKLSIERASRETRIQSGYLNDFEKGRLPSKVARVYGLQLMRNYCRFLGVDAGELNRSSPTEPTTKKRWSRSVRVKADVVTSRLISLGSLWLLLLAIISYVIWQVVVLSSAPMLNVSHPKRDIVTNQAWYRIKGQSTAGAEIAINDVAVLSNPDGSFSAVLPLRPGLNAFSISATNKLNKTRTVERSVIYDRRSLDEQ